MSITFLKRNRTLLILALAHLGFYVILGLFPFYFAGDTSIVPYNAQQINVQKAFQAPSWQISDHFLGTDHLGRDILAGIIYGCQTSLWVSLPSMIIATTIGLVLGIFSGYFGNRKRANVITLLLYGIALVAGSYYSFYLLQFTIKDAFAQNLFEGFKMILLCLAIIAICLLIAYLLKTLILKKKMSNAFIGLPIDEAVLKLTALFSSVPKLILILALASFLRPSLGILVSIIGFTSWTGMARLVRGEVMKTKNLQYIQTATALGIKDKTIMLKHILPNILASIAVAFTFGLANLLAVEATLSFLGIGLPPDHISWGKIIAGVQHNLLAWWIIVFPGAYLGLTVLSLHYCNNYFLRR